jgi:hypothetical protein
MQTCAHHGNLKRFWQGNERQRNHWIEPSFSYSADSHSPASSGVTQEKMAAKPIASMNFLTHFLVTSFLPSLFHALWLPLCYAGPSALFRGDAKSEATQTVFNLSLNGPPFVFKPASIRPCSGLIRPNPT